MATSHTYLCSACATVFPTDDQRRDHMREPWHVYNLKQSVNGTSTVTQNAYSIMVVKSKQSPIVTGTVQDFEHGQTRLSPHRTVRTHGDDQDIKETGGSFTEGQCLFCPRVCPSSDQNMQHMISTHSFSIPNQECLQTDVETLLSYLNLVVRTFHSCLFCDAHKTTTEGVQDHMLSRGHCMIDLSETSDFLEFWKDDEQCDLIKLSSLYLDSQARTFPPGTNVAIRPSVHKAFRPRRIPTAGGKHCTTAAAVDMRNQVSHSNTPGRPQDATALQPLTLARRDQQGITGLTAAQCSALARSQKRALSQDFRSRNAALWIKEKGGNKVKQVHFQPDVPGRRNG